MIRNIVKIVLVPALLAPAPASAAIKRAWVSAARGIDQANCGPAASPCRTLQYTHDNIVAAGGEIDVLDPGGYGAVVITKSLTIANDGVGLAGVQQSAAAPAIAVLANGSDRITLRGLAIDGLGVATIGVRVDMAQSVVIDHCAISHFVGAGVKVQQAANDIELYISHSNISENPGDGVNVALTNDAVASGVFAHSLFLDNGQSGVQLDNAPPNARSKFTVVDSVSSGNGNFGFRATANATLNLDRVVSSRNSTGLSTFSTGVIRVTRSTITDNGTAMSINLGTKIESFGDNVIRDNGVDIAGTGSFVTIGLR